MRDSPQSDIRHTPDNNTAPLTQRQKAVVRAREWAIANRERRKKYIKSWTASNPEKNKQYQRSYKLRLKRWAIEAYSDDSACKCCDENGLIFLTIDHIDGGGAEHRRSLNSRGGHAFYQWLRNNNYPPGYQILCFNCNSARGAFGYCHEIPPITIRPL